MPTLGELQALAATRLRKAGIEAPQREARLLLAEATGLPATTIMGYPERPAPFDPDRFEAMLARRAAREPLSRILGLREFWSLPFRIAPATLDPRADSETVIEAALAVIPDRDAPLRLLDLGTGSGCLLLALLSVLPHAYGTGIDRSAAALGIARENAAALGLAGRAGFVAGDWDAALAGPFDLILSNPPYIPSAEIVRLEPEVRDYDPLSALDGGDDGLDPYRRLAPAAARLLAPGGHVVFEHGQGQSRAVADLCMGATLMDIAVREDLAGIARTITARRPSIF